jgi:hypothetical protein
MAVADHFDTLPDPGQVARSRLHVRGMVESAVAAARHAALAAAYPRLLIDGLPSRPFSLCILPPRSLPRDSQRDSIIRRYSRQQYATPVARVQDEIRAAFASQREGRPSPSANVPR